MVSGESNSLLARGKDFLENLLALRITEAERIPLADGDPMNIFGEKYEGNKPLKVASVAALFFHFLLFWLAFPFLTDQVFIPSRDVLVLKQLALPSRPAGGSPQQAQAVQPRETTPRLNPVLVPIPDPTPFEPEPMDRPERMDTPSVLDEISTDLNIGDISAPGGRGQGGSGSGSGNSSGSGNAAGAGDGIYSLGSGVTNPVLLVKTIPSYTDDAVKAKVQGIVLLRAVIRKDGSVTDLEILRGLGYGLDEKAIEEIATKWKFRPGTLKGRPVNVLATIEVMFNLH